MVDVYLMQHGEAVPADVDPDRPLADVGRRNVLLVAGHAARCGVRLDRIVHSGKLRAAQTAQILAGAIGCPVVEEVAGLNPNGDVRLAAHNLVDPMAEGSLAVVGHLPFLDRFASLLVAREPEAQVVSFRNGGLVKLVPSSLGGAFVVAWVLTPDLAG